MPKTLPKSPLLRRFTKKTPGKIPKGREVPEEDAKYFIARLEGNRMKDSVKAADIKPKGNGLKQAYAIEKRLAADPNTALNQAFDRKGVDADLLAGYALELMQATLQVKDRDGETRTVPDNRTRLSALELVVKLRNMLTPKQTGDVNTVNFEQTIIMAADLMRDPDAMKKLMDKAKIITAEFSEVED